METIKKLNFICDFEPEKCFRENSNDLGVPLLLKDSFKESFLRNPVMLSMIPPQEVRGLRPIPQTLHDDFLKSALEDKLPFILAHIAELLVIEDSRRDGRTLTRSNVNFFFVPTPENLRRVFVTYLPHEQRWLMGVDQIGSAWMCRNEDLVYVEWPQPS